MNLILIRNAWMFVSPKYTISAATAQISQILCGIPTITMRTCKFASQRGLPSDHVNCKANQFATNIRTVLIVRPRLAFVNGAFSKTNVSSWARILVKASIVIGQTSFPTAVTIDNSAHLTQTSQI